MAKIEVTLRPERETKNTVRFQEVGDPDEAKIGTLYVPKATLKELGHDAKDSLFVTVEIAS